jgi:hypothetical protein
MTSVETLGYIRTSLPGRAKRVLVVLVENTDAPEKNNDKIQKIEAGLRQPQ